MQPKTIALFQLSLLAFALVLFVVVISPRKAPPVESLALVEETTRQVPQFPVVVIEARSAYVYDARTGKVLYQKDAELQWPLASLTKLMSVYTASKLVPDYMLVKINREDLGEEGDTGLRPDEEWNLGKLIDFTLVVSSNDGMRAIASVAGSQIGNSPTTTPEEFFIKKMNEDARGLGLKQTYFLNQSGLDLSSTLSGGYGSARDIAILMNEMLKTNSHILEATSFKQIDVSSKTEKHSAVNTNKALSGIPNVIASKTGFTSLSGGNVVVALNAGIDHPIIVSVLGSSYEGRFSDLKVLTDAALTYLSNTASTTQ